ncbi:hypothetical protein L1887_54441 [Cichorium endivia]|nr:hypothetical protein L1887_54441 [Cichorium endivia]
MSMGATRSGGEWEQYLLYQAIVVAAPAVSVKDGFYPGARAWRSARGISLRALACKAFGNVVWEVAGNAERGYSCPESIGRANLVQNKAENEDLTFGFSENGVVPHCASDHDGSEVGKGRVEGVDDKVDVALFGIGCQASVPAFGQIDGNRVDAAESDRRLASPFFLGAVGLWVAQQHPRTSPPSSSPRIHRGSQPWMDALGRRQDERGASTPTLSHKTSVVSATDTFASATDGEGYYTDARADLSAYHTDEARSRTSSAAHTIHAHDNNTVLFQIVVQ